MKDFPPPTIETLVKPDSKLLDRLMNDPKLRRMKTKKSVFENFFRAVTYSFVVGLCAIIGGLLAGWGTWYSIAWKITIATLLISFVMSLIVAKYEKKFRNAQANAVSEELYTLMLDGIMKGIQEYFNEQNNRTGTSGNGSSNPPSL